ncbi:TMAO reductase system periplasmic protein TorT [Pseudoduganella sp. FT26W]|uniref:TMAO reductase system periplasmic protein TorT n=1 Tax=Duganella aquatilis TaxID=2666082 RepID=A0A844CW88_9BURK|nr:TMAO reductase system periplasmic protein TorT [Duganella aquatilis]MRW84168.1 TMAO reductase system periplasmic protein TorT [Duganella aquatilis]
MKISYICGILGLCLPALAPAAPWYPAQTVADGRHVAYRPLPRVHKSWRICALFPHVRDRYWWGVSWGLVDEARRQGVKLGLYQAGGYDNLAVQQEQFQACLRKGADAILLASLSADGMNDAIAQAAARGVPVIDLITGVSSDKVSARSLVRFDDMARAATRYLLSYSRRQQVSIAWLPGPRDAGWVRGAEAGMYQAIRHKSVTLQHGGYGPPELTTQMGLVRAILRADARYPDYFLGNSVAIEAAANYMHHYPQVASRAISFYATEPVLRLIAEGKVLAAVSDSPVLQARIGLDLALRILEKQPHAYSVSPKIEVIDAGNVAAYDLSRVYSPEYVRITQQALPN